MLLKYLFVAFLSIIYVKNISALPLNEDIVNIINFDNNSDIIDLENIDHTVNLQNNLNIIDLENEINTIDIDAQLSSEDNQTGKIVGGSNAKPHLSPWIVSLQYVSSHPKHHFCGGAIIRPSWIITAGHCLKAFPTFDHVEAVAGRYNLLARESSEQRRTIKRIFIHPKYEGGVGPNDIGLIQLNVPFQYTEYIKEVSLPVANSLPAGVATLYGWGSTTSAKNSPTPSILQTMTVPLITIDHCRSALSSFAGLIQNTNLCTGPYGGRPTACSGDSGSALTQNGVIIGTVSWGLTPCASPYAASVYVRVSAYKPWILLTIAQA